MECPQCGGPVSGSEKACAACVRLAKGAAWAKWTWRLGVTSAIICAVGGSFSPYSDWSLTSVSSVADILMRYEFLSNMVVVLSVALPPLSVALGLIALVLCVKALRVRAATRKTYGGMLLGLGASAIYLTVGAGWLLPSILVYQLINGQSFGQAFD